MTQLEHCTKGFLAMARTSLFMRGRSNDTIGTLHERLSGDWQEQACLCEAVAMTQLEHCTRAFWRLARTGLFVRGRSNDTIGTLHEGSSGDWQELAGSCEVVAMTQLEHCTRAFWRLARTGLFMRGRSNDTFGTLHEGFLAIGKNMAGSCDDTIGIARGLFCRLASTGFFMRDHSNDTIGTLHEGFLAIGKNRFVSARQQQ